MGRAHRIDVVDALLAAMARRDPQAVLDVLERTNPTREEIDAASGLRRLDITLDEARAGRGR